MQSTGTSGGAELESGGAKGLDFDWPTQRAVAGGASAASRLSQRTPTGRNDRKINYILEGTPMWTANGKYGPPCPCALPPEVQKEEDKMAQQDMQHGTEMQASFTILGSAAETARAKSKMSNSGEERDGKAGGGRDSKRKAATRPFSQDTDTSAYQRKGECDEVWMLMFVGRW